MAPESEREFAEVRSALQRAVLTLCPSWLRAQAEDVVQEATMRVMQIVSRPEKELADLGPSYLWKVAHSTLMDEIRRRRRSREVQVDEPAEAAPDPGSSQSPLQVSTETRQAIDAGLRVLDGPRRSAVLLYLYGFSLRDTAKMLGWNTKRADNMRHLGLKELRRYLEERGFEP